MHLGAQKGIEEVIRVEYSGQKKMLVWELGVGEGEDIVSPLIYYVRDFDKMIQPSEHLMHIQQSRWCW